MNIQHCKFTLRKSTYTQYAKLLKPVFNHLTFPTPNVIADAGAVSQMIESLQQQGITRPVIITDQVFSALPVFQILTDALISAGLNYKVFNDVQPDPDFLLIDKGIAVCIEHRFDSVIAIGGGSSIDAAKVINCCAFNGYQSRSTVGMFKVKCKGAYFVAIPTTAGTGSETTIVSVVTDEKTHQKKQVISMKIVPDLAILDPKFMIGLPASITAATGMDALTHAIESYLSLYSTPKLDEMNLATIRDIFEFLPQCYGDGASSLTNRLEMAKASHNAGVAFTQTSVGWVHAIAHQLGAFYNMPHGLANAVVLPHVLEFYAPVAFKRMAEIATALGVTEGGELDRANVLVDKVKALCNTLNIRPKADMIQLKDLQQLSANVINETYTNPYPVPRYFSSQIELERLIYSIFR